MPDKPQLPTLQAIAAWLEGSTPPSEMEASELFNTIIPAAMDLEVARLHERSKELLKQAAALAGIEERKAVEHGAWLAGEAVVPESCAVCPSAKPVYSYGSWMLRCMYQDEDAEVEVIRRPVLATVRGEEAFHQPAEVSHGQLKGEVSVKPPPGWCPRR